MTFRSCVLVAAFLILTVTVALRVTDPGAHQPQQWHSGDGDDVLVTPRSAP